MQTAQTKPPIPASFIAMTVATPILTFAAFQACPPSEIAMPAGIPLLFLLGLYFAVCSTFFQEFALYRLKVARAVAWYGEEATHFLYRVLGFAAMGASGWMLLGTLF